MNKSFKEWFGEGESLYATSLSEYQALESQIEQLEANLADKREEVNQIAQMLGKPAVENNKRVTAQIVEHDAVPVGAIGAVTRALTGRGIVAR